jgi:hypothetical protein
MPAAVTIELSYPVEHAGETIAAVTLRSPTLRDLRLGAAGEWHESLGGMVYFVNHNAVIRAYLERCVSARGPEFLKTLRLKDVMRVRDAMLRLWIGADSAATKIFNDAANARRTQTKGTANG